MSKPNGAPGTEHQVTPPAHVRGDTFPAPSVTNGGQWTTPTVTELDAAPAALAYNESSIDFLQWLRPDGPWVITAIIPDGVTDTRTFDAASEDNLRAFIAENNGFKNLYYTSNPTKAAVVVRKPKGEHIAAAEFAHCECDPDKDETPDVAKARILHAMEQVPLPTFVVDSGNGIQALWRLAEPTTDFAKAVQINKTLIRLLGGDPGSHNIDRLLRLPGTTNLPTESKRRKGRIICAAKLLAFNDIAYRLDTLPCDDEEEGFLHKYKEDAGKGMPATAYPPPTVARVKAALAVLDPDMSRDKWLKVGMSVYAAIGDAGQAPFEQWSATSKEGKWNKEAQGIWEECRKVKEVTAGTLFKWATEADPTWWQRIEGERRFLTKLDEEPNKPGTAEDGGHHERDQEEQEWPTLGDDAYYGIAGEITRTIEPHSEADPVAILIQMLAMAGNMVGRSAYYQVESSRHYPNIFANMVGDTSKARKGTSFDRVRAVMEVAEQSWTQDRIKGGLSSGEGLIYEVRDPVQKRNGRTGEMETIPGVSDKRLMVVEPEFASVLTVAQRGGNNISQNLRKAWDGGVLETLSRQQAGLRATGAHISIIGHITVAELRTSLTRTEAASGFANRFLYALIKRSKLLPFGGELSDSEIVHMGELLKAKLWPVRGPVSNEAITDRVTMTDAAREYWNSIYGDLSAVQEGLLGAITARAGAQTVRLALIYCLLDGKNQIDLPHLQAALAVWRYCEASAAHIFGKALGDPVADIIFNSLKATGASGLTRTAIFNLFGRHQSADRVAAALDLLLQKGLAWRETHKTGGRPVEAWRPA